MALLMARTPVSSANNNKQAAIEKETDKDDSNQEVETNKASTATATRKRTRKSSAEDENETETAATKKTPAAKPKAAATAASLKKKKTANDDEEEEEDNKEDKVAAQPKATKTRGAAARKPSAKKVPDSKDNDDDNDDEAKKNPPKKKKAADHQQVTERDELPKLWNAEKAQTNGSYTFKIASWNVAGLRALMRNSPDALANLCKEHDLDMLCLQETKLQEMHLDDPKLKIRGHLLQEEGYDAYYSCSGPPAKKGYSGTAVFTKRHSSSSSSSKKATQKTIASFFGGSGGGSSDAAKAEKKSSELPVSTETLTPVDVSYNLGKDIDAEGRVIMVDFPFASIANVYVPNSGQKLERLQYRTEGWDKDFLSFIQKKQADRGGLPVLWLGDLNVAFTAMEVWNDGAKHLAKQAGVTAEERACFQEQLDAGFVDAFRKLHPQAKGQYSYWSQRAGNREPNKGLRLDYFICSPDLFSEESNVVVRDSYMLMDVTGSDHCPVVLELEIKG
jgi:exodeoxyribonuclease-3